MHALRLLKAGEMFSYRAVRQNGVKNSVVEFHVAASRLVDTTYYATVAWSASACSDYEFRSGLNLRGQKVIRDARTLSLLYSRSKYNMASFSEAELTHPSYKARPPLICRAHHSS